jgi:uncharacterized membrane protein
VIAETKRGSMEIKLKQYWFNIKNSLWFLPAIMAMIAIVLAFILIEVDNHISYDNFPMDWFVYGGQREGARSVLSTIASSMVTIAGVTFSITLVALTMASSQFGPRLLRNFTSDRGNQFVIGTFISTFVYSLIILLSIRSSDTNSFVPKISVVFAFLLAIFSLGVIIYFIHHVTVSIQADYVIKSSYNDFKKVADSYLLNEKETTEDVSLQQQLKKAKNEFSKSTEVCFHTTGYIQSIDYSRACTWAQENDAVLEWLVYPGMFASIYEAFVMVHYKKELPDDTKEQLSKLIVIAYQRTPNQDLLFSLKQIVEVGVRALSPGTNDPHTATACIQWIGAALSEIANKKFGTPLVKDDNDNIRLFIKQITYGNIVDTCFDQLRLYAKSNIYVTAELLCAIKKPLQITKSRVFQKALHEKAEDVFREIRQAHQDYHLQKIETLYREIMQLHQQTV